MPSTADEQLKVLIAMVEEESDHLRQRINHYLQEEEYLLAHFHAEELQKVQWKLHTLYNLADNLYDEKDSVQKRIDYFERLRIAQVPGITADHFEKELQRAKRELENLYAAGNLTESPQEVTIFDDVIDKLFERRIKNVKLILHRKENFVLALNYSGSVLKVTIANMKHHVAGTFFEEDKIQSFNSLDFVMNEKGTKLVLAVKGEKEATKARLKLILTKIVFDIFYFREFEKQTFIQFVEKRGQQA